MRILRNSTRPQQSKLVEAIRPALVPFAIVGAFSFFLNALYLATPLYMLNVYDRVLVSGQHWTLFYLTLIALIALAILGAMDAIRGAMLARIGAWFHRRLGDLLLVAGIRRVLLNQTDSATQPLRDMDQIRAFVSGTGLTPLFDLPWTFIFIGAIFLLHPMLGIFAAVSAIALFLAALVAEIVTRAPLTLASRQQIIAHEFAEGAGRQAETIIAMGMWRRVQEAWRRADERATTAQVSAAEWTAGISGFSRFLRLFIQVAVLGIGAMLVLRSELTAGGMIAASIVLGRALAPVEQSIFAWRAFVSARLSYGRLKQVLDETPDQSMSMRLPQPKGRVTIEAVTYRPPSAPKPILNNISLEINSGDTVAIIGPSASGKSSLCRIFCGVLGATRGTARLDGADILRWQPEQRALAIGYLPQEVRMFPGTVRANIARLEEGDPELILEAAQLAQVHELILQMPEGYETPLGPDGYVLSSGQRQRIGLARALYRTPPLVVLDEPNSNLDHAGDAALAAALVQLRRDGSTVVIVTHRQPILSVADKIVVMDAGRIEQFGPRDLVLRGLADKKQGTDNLRVLSNPAEVRQ